jgi:hypothetical protein
MRLTLRTLLAYLDDTLEPSQAKLIGQKVADSDAAQELIARIKQVTRRRRLTTPPNSGPGAKLDPNSIAEYLDNALSSEQLAEVEETCLASDVHLAEVAACHQILTLVLGEPALVPPTARQRMYGLIKGRESIVNRKAPASPVGQGAVEGSELGGDDADEGLLLGWSMSRSGSGLRWLIPLAAACLLLGAALAIGIAMVSSWPPANANKTVTPDDNRVAAAHPAETPPPESPPPAERQTQPEEKGKPVVPPVTKTQPEPKKDAEANARTEPAKKNDTPPEAAPPPAKPAPAQVLPPRTDRREIGKALLVAATPPVLLQRPAEGGAWQRLKPQSRLFSTDSLVSLPGYYSELRTDRDVGLVLWGNLPEFSRLPVLESSVVLYANPQFDLDFKLDRGRVVLANQKPSGPVRIRVRFYGETWDITLPDQKSEVALDLIGECQPYSKETGGGEPDHLVRLYALKGQPSLKFRYEEYLMESPSTFDWDNTLGPAPSPRQIPRPPDWYAKKQPQTREVQNTDAALRALANRLVAKDSIDVVLGESLRDGDTAGRLLAIHCLGALNEWSKLLDALADDRHVQVRVVAILEIRHLLGLDAKNDELLSQALRNKGYSPAHAQLVIQLLHGLSEQQWALPATRTTLVEYLMHDRLPVRQMTHILLATHIPEGGKIPYDPAGDFTQRERGYEDWKRLVSGGKPKEPRG